MGYENPYQSPYAGSYAPTAELADTHERAAFIRRTYAHLTGAIFAFAAIEAVIFTLVPAEAIFRFTMTVAGPWSWLILLGGFMIVSWVARSWAQNSTSRQTQYMGLGLYVVAQAIIFVPLLCIAQTYTRDPWLIPSAGIITLLTFGGLTAAVFLTRSDFSFLGMYLALGGLVAIGLVVCGIFMGFSLGIWFSVAMVALACGYILYDTSNVLHHYRTDQHVAASLALFASVALLFWYVIRILMYLNGRE
ncbi:MAG: Bax inhibitor-1 family protein [Planctomycetes bacterium]|nr:Bax inhibitor-1 family protein [Planctomycetota bacterium]